MFNTYATRDGGKVPGIRTTMSQIEFYRIDKDGKTLHKLEYLSDYERLEYFNEIKSRFNQFNIVLHT